MLDPLDRFSRDSSLFQFTDKRLRDFIDPRHLLIQIDEQFDFPKLVEPLEEYYCRDQGRPAIHPEVLVRALLISSLYNITSFRRLCFAISENIAFRWFCFLTIDDKVFVSIARNIRPVVAKLNSPHPEDQIPREPSSPYSFNRPVTMDRRGGVELLLFSISVTGNCSARMSHYGECDVEPKGTGKASGSQQLAGGTYDDRAGICADGSEHTPYLALSGGIQEGSSRRPGSRSSRSQSAQRDIGGNEGRCAASGTHTVRGNQPHTYERVLREHEGIDVTRSTLRRLLVSAGESSPRGRRPPKHRVRRQRMPREGMLIQIDGSHHRWLGEDGPQFTPLLAVDDTTGVVADALFGELENTRSYLVLMQGLIRHSGIPLALYADRHAVFKHTPSPETAAAPTQFSRAMDELGIQLIFARSPQAKGRVERTAGTFQDRLVTELRLAGATTIDDANRVLEGFLPRFNTRFGVVCAGVGSRLSNRGRRDVSGEDPVLQVQA